MSERLVFYFGLMPAASSSSLVVACLLYPKVFLPIAQMHLVFGSFFACVILLFVSLLCLSAMNPILVALRHLQLKKPEGGDSGAVTNILVMASHRGLEDVGPAPLSNVPARLHQSVREMLRSQRQFNRAALSTAGLLTDDDNVYAFLNGTDMLVSRERMISQFPPEFLVN